MRATHGFRMGIVIVSLAALGQVVGCTDSKGDLQTIEPLRVEGSHNYWGEYSSGYLGESPEEEIVPTDVSSEVLPIDPVSAGPVTPESPRTEPSDSIYLPPPAIAPELPVANIPADLIAVVPANELAAPNLCNNPVAQRLYREDGSHFLGVKCDDGICRDIWGNATSCEARCDEPVSVRLKRPDGSSFIGMKCNDGLCRDIWGNEATCDIVQPVAAKPAPTVFEAVNAAVARAQESLENSDQSVPSGFGAVNEALQEAVSAASRASIVEAVHRMGGQCGSPVSVRLYRGRETAPFLGVQCDDGICRNEQGQATECAVVCLEPRVIRLYRSDNSSYLGYHCSEGSCRDEQGHPVQCETAPHDRVSPL